MKNEWLNLVLSLTNSIYQRKQRMVEQTGFKVFSNVIILIILELVLGVISLPLYLTLKPQKTAAYFAEKDTYGRINFDYNLRRILTITGVGIIALIWMLKLLLILFFPLVHGPLNLYSVSNFEQVDILNKNLVNIETGFQTARVVDTMNHPELTEVRKINGQDYSFMGKGQPNTTVVLLLSDSNTAVYTSAIDKNGDWQIDQQQKNFKLKDGNHSVVVFGYDAEQGIKSNPAPEQFFKTSSSAFDFVLRNIDSLINWVIVAVISIGLFLILLTI